MVKLPRSHEIDEKGFHEKLCSSDRSGQPDITPSVIEAHNLSENIRVEQIHDRSGQLDERNSSSAHTLKEQHAPEVHREIALLQHEQRVQSCNQRGGHWLQHSRRTAFYSFETWFRKSRTTRIGTLFNETYNKVNHSIPSAKNQKKWFHEVGNVELCELLDMEHKAQCTVFLSYWDAGIVYCTCGHFLRNGTEENKKFVQYTMDLLSIPNYYIKKGRPHGHRYGKEARGPRVLHREFAQEEMQKEVLLGYPRPVHTRREVPQEHIWHRSQWRTMSWDGRIGERRPHAPPNSRRNSRLQSSLVDSFKQSWFRYDAS